MRGKEAVCNAVLNRINDSMCSSKTAERKAGEELKPNQMHSRVSMVVKNAEPNGGKACGKLVVYVFCRHNNSFGIRQQLSNAVGRTVAL